MAHVQFKMLHNTTCKLCRSTNCAQQ